MVTNLFLWRQALNEKRGGAKIRRLVRNLPLYIQILGVILASLALAKPVWFSPPRVKGDAVLILDTSASMKTKTASGTRFDQARSEALKLIEDLPKGGKMLVIEAEKTFIVDKQAVLERAERLGIIIVARRGNESQ